MIQRLTLLTVLAACTVGARSPLPQPADECRARPDLVGKCFNVRGRLSVYNGTPSIRLSPSGSKRLLGIIDPNDTSHAPGPSVLPAEIKSKLDWDKNVFGNFFVCPLTRSHPGKMQTVCIESGKNLIVREHEVIGR